MEKIVIIDFTKKVIPDKKSVLINYYSIIKIIKYLVNDFDLFCSINNKANVKVCIIFF